MGQPGADELDAAPDGLAAPESEQLEVNAGAVACAHEGEVGHAHARAGQVEHRRLAVDRASRFRGARTPSRSAASSSGSEGAPASRRRSSRRAPSERKRSGRRSAPQRTSASIDQASHAAIAGSASAELEPVARAALEQAERPVELDAGSRLRRPV